MKRVLTALLAVVVFASCGTIAKAAVDYSELGDTGTSVTQIQQKLYDLGFLVSKPTGYFGAGTQAAVTNFQKSSGLTADGKAGPATIKALFGSSSTTSSTTSSSATTTSSNDVLRYGDNNKYVTQLQQALYDKGFLTAKPTGYYGTSTRAAVTNYQKSTGLTADGKAGPATRKSLLGANYASLISSSTTTSTTTTNGDSSEINPGDKGAIVSTIQTKLKSLGYYTYSKITQFYGPITEVAVRAFQKANGLTVDGIIGAKTLSKLNSSSAISKSAATKTTTTAKTTTTTSTTASSSKTVQVLGASSSSNTKIEAMIAYAKSKIGSKYVWGATGPNSFDCSGLSTAALKSVGVSAPRTSSAQSQVSSWDKVTRANLQRGDLVFFHSSSRTVGHVGIYLGDGQFIHASSGVGRVTISSIDSSYYKRNFVCGRRVF